MKLAHRLIFLANAAYALFCLFGAWYWNAPMLLLWSLLNGSVALYLWRHRP